jgi:hypothetical protein
MGTRFLPLFRCIGAVALLALAVGLNLQPAAAQTCLQQEYNANPKDKQTLNCSANDVRVASVSGITDLSGNPLTTCIEGSTFSFIANFEVVTTANATNAGGRDNIGLYFQTDPTKPDALVGSCVDNIISPAHPCNGGTGTCGVTQPAFYQEFDPSPDNCGDTSSSVNPDILIRIVVNNFLCQAPVGSSTLVLPNCTSWQTPGSSSLCQSSAPVFPYPTPPAATPGSPSKCNCGIINLPITPVTPTVLVQKACTTGQTPGPAAFTQGANPTQSPTQCNAGNGTTTESEIANYTIAVTNTTGTSAITVDQICDSAYGNVFTAASFTGPACAAGSQCTNAAPPNNAAGGYCGNSGTTCGALNVPATGTTTATCTFSAGPQPELTTVGNSVTVKGHANLNTSRTFTGSSNSVSVTSTEVPTTASVTKTVVGTRAACATVRYQVDVKNTSALDEVESLSALSDSSYGNITQCTNANCASGTGANGSVIILGTTCGVANGIGTLTGTTGAGALSKSLNPSDHYICQFDGQFCSALDSNGCISNTDTASATLKGDEASDQSFTSSSVAVTVKECLATTVTP